MSFETTSGDINITPKQKPVFSLLISLTAFFSQKYSTKEDFNAAYLIYNKKYRRHARKNKLPENAFEIKVKQVLNHINTNGTN